VQRAAAAFKVALLRTIVDDKGVRCLLAGGVPGFAAEDDAWRAVSLCAACAEELHASGLRVRRHDGALVRHTSLTLTLTLTLTLGKTHLTTTSPPEEPRQVSRSLTTG